MHFLYELQKQKNLIRLERSSSSLVRRIWSDLFWPMSMLRSYHQFPYLTTLFIDLFLRCKTVVKQLKSSSFKLFSLQLDESTDVSSCAQLMVYVRYVHDKKFKEEFLLCCELETTTKAQNVSELINRFFQENKIDWKNLCGVCTDGAPAMLGSRFGFQKLVKDRSPEVTSIHCMIHRQALA